MRKIQYKKIIDIGQRIVTGKTPPTKKSENFSDDYPFITPSDIPSYWEKFIIHTERGISIKGSKYLRGYILPKDSICVVCIGSTIGKMCFTHRNCYTNQQINSIVPKSEYNAHYLFYLLRFFKGYFQLIGGGTGSGKGILNKTTFSKIKLPVLEDRDIQNKIANILAIYDDLIEKNNRKIAILQEMAEELYKEWFVRFRFPGHKTAKFKDGIPEGWEYKKLSDVATILMGQSPSSEFYNNDKNGLPFHQGVGSYGKLFLKDTVYSTKGERIAEPNSIIFSVRAPVGRINRNLNKIILGRGIAAINAKDKSNAFLLYSLMNQFQKEDIIGNGSIFMSATKHEIESIEVIYPTLDILESFNCFVQNIENQFRVLYLKNRNLTQQRDLLLPRLMSGKLKVKA